MILSMTGYAETRLNCGLFHAKIHIRSLNHRFLDWTFRGAPLGIIEDRMREAGQKKIHRGRLEVSVEITSLDADRWEFHLNEGIIRKMVRSLEKASATARRPISLSLGDLLGIPHAVEFPRKGFAKDEAECLLRCFLSTLDKLVKERKREGEAIRKQLKTHARTIGALVRQIERKAKKQPSLIQERLEEKLKDLAGDREIQESRLMEEVSFLAQRYDLTEEVVRLKSHLAYLKEILDSPESGPKGKKLDFVAQELYREANTINSKAQDIEVVRLCLGIKAEVEGIRQQVQNVE